MHRFGYLLLYLLTASLLTSSTVHARESSLAPTIECSGIVHNYGDVDQSRGMPHHHGSCHSTPAFVPTASNDMVKARTTMFRSVRSLLLSSVGLLGPDLRPPIA